MSIKKKNSKNKLFVITRKYMHIMYEVNTKKTKIYNSPSKIVPVKEPTMSSSICELVSRARNYTKNNNY